VKASMMYFDFFDMSMCRIPHHFEPMGVIYGRLVVASSRSGAESLMTDISFWQHGYCDIETC
jgi:hypothetical protein